MLYCHIAALLCTRMQVPPGNVICRAKTSERDAELALPFSSDALVISTTSMTIVPSAIRMRLPGFTSRHSFAYEIPIFVSPVASSCTVPATMIHPPACN